MPAATDTTATTSIPANGANSHKEPKTSIASTTTVPEKGRPIYTPLVLLIYDFWVLGVVNTFAWGCSTTRYLLPQFRANVRSNNLDVGVGTGYYLDKAQIPHTTRLTLIDIEQEPLETAQRRSRRFDANLVIADILQPLSLNEKFDSVSMYYLFHCISATMQEKCGVFSHIKYNMTADGVIHGANILGKGVAQDNWFGKWIRAFCLSRGLFHNGEDNAYEFEDALRRNFKKVETWVVGTIFIWRAEGPKLDE
jgi:SAM-dependent methyltransferase